MARIYGANGQKEDAASFFCPFFCPRSFDRAVTVAAGSSVVRSTTRDAGDPGSNPALGKQWSRDYPIDIPATPTLPYANLRYQDALDRRKWIKGGCSFLVFFA